MTQHPQYACSCFCRFSEVFISETSEELKKMVIDNFIHNETATRIVACTEAFGLGLDCGNIRQIIHQGPSKTIQNYVQETGRAGRDNRQARAILLPVSSKYTDKAMVAYSKQKGTCSRQYIFTTCLGFSCTDAVTNCRCCVVCAEKCVVDS